MERFVGWKTKAEIVEELLIAALKAKPLRAYPNN
jgi:hypothetical protein